MKKKLFVWAYTHLVGSVQTCALTEDGDMLFSVSNALTPTDQPRSEAHQKQHKENIRLLIAGNDTLNEEYNVVVANQQKLEAHMYDGASREENVDAEFRKAWDLFKKKQASMVEKYNMMMQEN
jgi:hypothetical protein